MKRSICFVLTCTLLLLPSCASHRTHPAATPGVSPSDGSNAAGQSGVDVLSDTRGVDFGPYLSHLLHSVRENWHSLIPVAARAPLMKQGRVTIEFAILKDGRIAALMLTESSGDITMDRAAYNSIGQSNQFPPLPKEFRGDHLSLRFHFLYNPPRN